MKLQVVTRHCLASSFQQILFLRNGEIGQKKALDKKTGLNIIDKPVSKNGFAHAGKSITT